MKEAPKVEIKDKMNLTIPEAAIYSGISDKTLRNKIKENNYDFVLKVGTKTLIKRRLFEKFIESTDAI